MNALDVVGISVRFGGVTVVDNVDLRVAAGEIVGLIGPNGSGKTSLVDAISGFERYRGRVSLFGESLDGTAPHVRARRGLARTFQGLELFDDLSVEENVGVTHGERDVAAALASLGAEGLRSNRVRTLDNAQRRLVALARAVVAAPRVLMVDEVAAGLDRAAKQRIAECLRAAAAGGAGVLVVDHDLDLVLGLAHRVVVLDRGRVLAAGAPTDVRADPAVVAAYLGSGL